MTYDQATAQMPRGYAHAKGESLMAMYASMIPGMCCLRDTTAPIFYAWLKRQPDALAAMREICTDPGKAVEVVMAHYNQAEG